MYMYIYIYIYVHVCTYTYIYICIHKLYMRVYVYIGPVSGAPARSALAISKLWVASSRPRASPGRDHVCQSNVLLLWYYYTNYSDR